MGKLLTMVRNASEKTIRFAGGSTHFIAQSCADLIAHTEGHMLSKLTDAGSPAFFADRRAEQTYNRQRAVLDRFSKAPSGELSAEDLV